MSLDNAKKAHSTVRRLLRQRDETIQNVHDRYAPKLAAAVRSLTTAEHTLFEALVEGDAAIVQELERATRSVCTEAEASEAAETVDKREPVDANDYAAANPDLSTIAPSLREPVPPLNAIVKERR